MIVRMWRGVTPADKADRYLGYLQATGLQAYRATPGNRGAQILQRIHGDEAEFLFVTLWDSLEAIRSFTGDDIERAVYYPEDGEFLLDFAPTVAHYEVLVDSR